MCVTVVIMLPLNPLGPACWLHWTHSRVLAMYIINWITKISYSGLQRLRKLPQPKLVKGAILQWKFDWLIFASKMVDYSILAFHHTMRTWYFLLWPLLLPSSLFEFGKTDWFTSSNSNLQSTVCIYMWICTTIYCT